MISKLASEPASLSDFVRTLPGYWFILPQHFELPETVLITACSRNPGSGTQRIFVLEFGVWSVEMLSTRPSTWPDSAVQAEAVSYDGRNLQIVADEMTIRMTLDVGSPVRLNAFEFDITSATEAITAAQLQSASVVAKQVLSPMLPTLGKAVIGPPKGPIFTPPREYYVPRDVKSLLGVVSGLGLILLGFYVLVTTGGLDPFAWVPIVAGAWIIAATILDIALFPPWRLWPK